MAQPHHDRQGLPGTACRCRAGLPGVLAFGRGQGVGQDRAARLPGRSVWSCGGRVSSPVANTNSSARCSHCPRSRRGSCPKPCPVGRARVATEAPATRCPRSSRACSIARRRLNARRIWERRPAISYRPCGRVRHSAPDPSDKVSSRRARWRAPAACACRQNAFEVTARHSAGYGHQLCEQHVGGHLAIAGA